MTIDAKFRNLSQRELVVFDFDETIVACNSDTWIHKLAPNQKIPPNLLYRHGQDYFKHVQAVLVYLHSQKVTEQDYVKCLNEMPSVPGMTDVLLPALAKQPEKYDMIILSDSNTFFISAFLKFRKLEEAFLTVLTNSARFKDGQLVTNEFHIQDYCSLSARNLCKGDALKNFIGKRMLEHNTVYSCINYIGDGENDLCPCLKLNARDRVFARKGYSLDRLCTKLKINGGLRDPDDSTSKVPDLKATVYSWSTGDEILETIMPGASA